MKKIILISLVTGLLLASASIVIGKKTHFSVCDYENAHTNVVKRGAPFAYFTVTPSISTCVNTDGVGAVFASDVGNDVDSKAFFADWLIWSAISAIVLVGIKKLTRKDSPSTE